MKLPYRKSDGLTSHTPICSHKRPKMPKIWGSPFIDWVWFGGNLSNEISILKNLAMDPFHTL